MGLPSVLDLLDPSQGNHDPVEHHLNAFPGNREVEGIWTSLPESQGPYVETKTLTATAKRLTKAGYTVHRPRYNEPVLFASPGDVLFMRGGDYTHLTVLVMPNPDTMLPSREAINAVQEAFHHVDVPVTVNLEHTLVVAPRSLDARRASCFSATDRREAPAADVTDLLRSDPHVFTGRPGSLAFVSVFGTAARRWMNLTGTATLSLSACQQFKRTLDRMNPPKDVDDPTLLRGMTMTANSGHRSSEIDDQTYQRVVDTIGDTGSQRIHDAVDAMTSPLNDLVFASQRLFHAPDWVLRSQVLDGALRACALGTQRRKHYGARVLNTTLLWIDTAVAFLDFTPRASQIGGWSGLTLARWMDTGFAPNEAALMLDLINHAQQDGVARSTLSVSQVARESMENATVNWHRTVAMIVEQHDVPAFWQRHNVSTLTANVTLDNDMVLRRSDR